MKSRKPSIVIWIPELSLDVATGGAEIRTLHLARALAAQGFHAVVLAGRVYWGLPHWSSIATNQGEVRVLLLPSPGMWLLGSAVHVLFVSLYLMTLPQVHVVAIASANRVAGLLTLAVRSMGKRVVCRPMGGDTRLLTKLSQKGHPAVRAHVWALQKAHAVISQSSNDAALLSALGLARDKIIRIPNGVDTSHYQPYAGDKAALRTSLALWQDAQIICCVNRLHPIKRVDLILAAFRLVSLQVPGARLLVVGDGYLRNQLQQMADSLGVQERVRFEGQVREPLRYLQASDAFVLASDEENQSNALIEAMACGLPVVATEVSGNKECIQHEVNGLLVPPSSPAQMANALLRIFSDQALATHLGAQARRSAFENHSFERMVDQYLQVFDLPNSATRESLGCAERSGA